MNNHKLLRATTIIDRHFGKNSLHNKGSDGKDYYCALGAIGKAYKDSGEIDAIHYWDIPTDDVVVLAAVMAPEELDEVLYSMRTGEKMRKGSLKGYTSMADDIQSIVTAYNDEHTKEEVVAKFKEACKDYDRYLSKISEAKRAVKAWEKRGKIESPLKFLSDKKETQDDSTKPKTSA